VRLFQETNNLTALSTSVLSGRSGLREIARYLTAPPVSDDDLKTLAGLGSANGPEYLAEMPLSLTKVKARNIPGVRDFLAPGEFCRQSAVGSTRADFTIGLRDRLLAIECKSSNSEVNSYKRLNHEVGNKAASWKRSFGETVVPAAVLAGVFKLENLNSAQSAGIAVFWEHDLETLSGYVRAAC
jgi:hypothetical protein